MPPFPASLLIHKNYRKLCNLLVDIDEWGQSAVIHMLTRYARLQFVDPNKAVSLTSNVQITCLVCSLQGETEISTQG